MNPLLGTPGAKCAPGVRRSLGREGFSDEAGRGQRHFERTRSAATMQEKPTARFQ